MLKNNNQSELTHLAIQTRSAHGSESQGLRDISIAKLIIYLFIYLGQRICLVLYEMENKRGPTLK